LVLCPQPTGRNRGNFRTGRRASGKERAAALERLCEATTICVKIRNLIAADAEASDFIESPVSHQYTRQFPSNTIEDSVARTRSAGESVHTNLSANSGAAAWAPFSSPSGPTMNFENASPSN